MITKVIQCEDRFGNINYFYRTEKGWNLVNKSLISLSYSNVSDNAAMLHFQLTNSKENSLEVARKYANHCKNFKYIDLNTESIK